MANRETVKSNIVTKNVPTVTNAILTDMLNAEMNDNIRFRQDVTDTIVTGLPSISINFTGYDRINLNRTGGSLLISFSGLDDGDVKYLFITKTPGQAFSFSGATDVTPITANIDSLATVLYEVFKKGSSIFVRAIAETVKQATTSIIGVAEIATGSENDALSSTTKMCVPGYLPLSTTGQKGLVELATTSEAGAGSDSSRAVTAAGVKTFVENIDPFIELTKNSGFSGKLHYRKDPTGMVHWRFWALIYDTNIGSTNKVQIGTAPVGFTPNTETTFAVLYKRGTDIYIGAVSFEIQSSGARIYLHGDPSGYVTGDIIDTYLVYNPAL